MKKNFCIYLFLIFSPFFVSGQEGCSSWSLSDLSIEGKVNCFSPQSKRVRHVYGQKWVDYQLQFNYDYNEKWKLFTAINGLSKKGHSFGYHSHSTKICLIPLSLGFEYSFHLLPCLNYYLGAGTTYSFLKIRDHSKFVHQHVYKNTWGGIFKTGMRFFLNPATFLDLSVDYFHQYFHFKTNHHASDSYIKRHSLNMSAFRAGFGLGIKF